MPTPTRAPVTTASLAERLGLAAHLAAKYADRITLPTYQAAAWQTELATLLATQAAATAATAALHGETKLLTRNEFGQASNLLARFRGVIIANLGEGHDDVVGTLAHALHGHVPSGSMGEVLATLRDYCLAHSAAVPLGEALQSPTVLALITKLQEYDPENIPALSAAEKTASEQYAAARGAAWTNLKQFVSLSEALFEPTESARAEFAALTELPKRVASTTTSTTPTVGDSAPQA